MSKYESLDALQDNLRQTASMMRASIAGKDRVVAKWATDLESQADAVYSLLADMKVMQEALEAAAAALETCRPGDTSTGHVIGPYFDEAACDAAEEQVRAALQWVKE